MNIAENETVGDNNANTGWQLTRKMLAAQTVHYKYDTVHFHIVNPHIARPEFAHMPGLMRPMWDLYWCAMDMNKSVTAARATAATRQLFQDNLQAPLTDQLIDTIMLYSGLESQTQKVTAALRLEEEKQSKARITKADGRKLYDGSWFVELEETKQGRK